MEFVALRRAHGLYNAVPNKSISKYELCCLFNKYFRNSEMVINKIDGVDANKSLKRTNYEFDFVIPDYETMIKEMYDWVKSHKDMYPHYENLK